MFSPQNPKTPKPQNPMGSSLVSQLNLVWLGSIILDARLASALSCQYLLPTRLQPASNMLFIDLIKKHFELIANRQSSSQQKRNMYYKALKNSFTMSRKLQGLPEDHQIEAIGKMTVRMSSPSSNTFEQHQYTSASNSKRGNSIPKTITQQSIGKQTTFCANSSLDSQCESSLPDLTILPGSVFGQSDYKSSVCASVCDTKDRAHYLSQ